MKLTSIPNWKDRHFTEGTAPSDMQIHRWLRDGRLPGRKVGGTWYIDENGWLADGDDLVERVLNEAR